MAGIYHKRQLPNYSVFDEARHFRAGTKPQELYRIGGARVGVAVCEDLWVADGPVDRLVEGGAELLVVANGSPYHQGKLAEREATVVATATSSGRPLVYANLVGAQDELVFDGGSMVADPAGRIVARAPRFDEAVVVADIDVPEVPLAEGGLPVVEVSGPVDRGDPLVPPPVAPLEPMAEIYGALITATRDYVVKSGFTDVCIGLSGGVDSALVATIAADALGPDHVHGVLMPSRYSSDHSVTDAESLIAEQGIDGMTIPIEDAHAALRGLLGPSVGDMGDGLVDENLQARIRGVLLMALSNAHGWLVLTTGNKSESAVGYSTLYGDTAGAYASIKDVYKTTVFGLSRWRNENRPGDALGPEGPVIPKRVITKPPSAELKPDQTDQDTLPPYDVLDPILQCLIEAEMSLDDIAKKGHDPDIAEQVWHMLDRAEYKRRQAPPGVKITGRAFGKERRYPITNTFRRIV